MPLFTVTGREPFPKVLVSKNSIEGVIGASIQKLKLPPGNYKLLLEKNGAIIDEDELLSALQPESELVILPLDEDWQGREKGGEFQSPIAVTPNISIGTRTLSVEKSSRSTPRGRSSDLAVPWTSFENVQGELESGSPLQPRSFRIIVHSLANYLVAKKDFTRTSCNSLVREVHGKHPEAFAIKDADGVLLSNGLSSFLASLYERVNLLKPPELKNRKGAKRQLIDDEDDNLSWDHNVNPKYDSYGCVAWQPPLPEGETRKDQESKRARALVEESSVVLVDLMGKTYWLQRMDLNSRKGDLVDVLILWPALKDSTHFLMHCSTLLGKDCNGIWYDTLRSQGHILFKYFDDYCSITKSTPHNQEQLRKLKDFSEQGHTAVSEVRSKQPLITSMFMMIMIYLLDKIDSIFCLVDVDTPEENVPATDRPLLLVKGRSMFDEGAQYFIMCEGKTILQPTSMNEAFMLHFLSFFAFNYNYPDDGRKYMEFIQRHFFKINPMEGHKRGPKAARTSILDPSVKKLMTNFSNFKTRLARDLSADILF
ncbi:DNA fragmentation factor subunit beta [Frankliniella fusca]|uniref:DNAation factor subunit beta n=1 Tax=Frankliniella fusca TaxID=407009 RepID=A0AAE1HGN1_9NEOP|nr:DNA fragmentation factor subunit beta [Frankliniella fusca]